MKHFSISYDRMLATFSAKGQIENIFSFAGPMVSVARSGLCHGTPGAATGNIEMNRPGRLPIKLYLQERAEGGVWPQDCNCRVLSYDIDFLKIMCLGEKKRGKF